jgi:hypothetical protein
MARRFLDPGSPLVTTVMIARTNSMVKFADRAKVPAQGIMPGTLGRVHSQSNGLYSVWLLDETLYNTIVVDVPLHLMGQYFKQHDHQVFAHLA